MCSAEAWPIAFFIVSHRPRQISLIRSSLEKRVRRSRKSELTVKCMYLISFSSFCRMHSSCRISDLRWAFCCARVLDCSLRFSTYRFRRSFERAALWRDTRLTCSMGLLPYGSVGEDSLDLDGIQLPQFFIGTTVWSSLSLPTQIRDIYNIS